ncbi:MAG: phosphatase [Phycisphaeraceae bacterium]|nr:MAG: phosphatase [Phycisphaeraceae bacterium]
MVVSIIRRPGVGRIETSEAGGRTRGIPMPSIHAFRALQYRGGSGDLSAVIAPPYDVLDGDDRAELLARDAGNIVAVDLPHVPAKELGPPAAYQGAAETLAGLIEAGTISQRGTPAIFAYRQRYDMHGKASERCGMICTLDAVPFGPREGGGILAHEQTFGGPKEDRLALMRATKTQTSPIFGLHQDEQGRATALVRTVMDERAADATAETADGVVHELWTIDDDTTINAYADALAGEDIFIADGHHRYTTALNYLEELGGAGSLPADHPARRTMFVLVGMSDPGLAIGPTHRVLGGMKDYSFEKFQEVGAGHLNFEAVDNDPKKFEQQIASIAEREHRNVFGIYDFDTGLCSVAWPADDDPLGDDFANKPEAWRHLDVAIVQHLIVEQICQPELNGGEPVKWAFPHTIDEVLELGKGKETGSSISGGGRPQLALIVRPTPLEAVREISRAGELMPQKSTFFFPKLATGLCLNPLA